MDGQSPWPCEKKSFEVAFEVELLIPGKFISREGNKFPGTRSGLDQVSIL